MTQAQTYTVLHSFKNSPPDGRQPLAALIRDTAGNVYGTAFGGAFDAGIVFKLDKTGKETALYNFTGGADGGGPSSDLVIDSAGNLYGTTVGGGDGYGIVFKLDTAGTETVLYKFSVNSNPTGGLVMDAAGNFYGGVRDEGQVFKLDSSGKESVLYSFAGGTDGAGPVGDLVLDNAVNLYGVTEGGGASDFGTVFKLDPGGTETVLHAFVGGRKDGAEPMAGLLWHKGNLYGTTSLGGAQLFCRVKGDNGGCGTVFKVSRTGKETLLYAFPRDGRSGARPYSRLVMDSGRNLYGTTKEGGTTNSNCDLAGCGRILLLGYKISTHSYMYAVENESHQEIIAFHWHPESEVTVPYLHIGYGAGHQVRPDVRKVHFNTGRVALEQFCQMLIKDFDVVPERKDAGEILAHNLEKFRKHKTW